MIPVLGSWILRERLLCVHSSHIFANKQATSFGCWTECFQSTEQKIKVTALFCIVINKAGVNTCCTCQPSPLVHPLPPVKPPTFLLWDLGTFCATTKRPCEHRWRRKVKHRLSLAWPGRCTWRQLHWQTAPPQKGSTGPHKWHHCNLLSMSCSRQQRSQASQTKAAECHEILWSEWEARR